MSLKTAYTAQTRPDAIFIRNMLIDGGIPASLSTDDANGNLPFLEMSEGVDVMVDDAAMADAKSLLEEYRNGATSITEDQGE